MTEMNLLILGFLPGGTEWVVILLVFIMLFGAKKIPDLAHGLGKAMREFQKAKAEFDHEIKSISSLAEDERRNLKGEMIRTPAETLSVEGKIQEGSFTGDGKVLSPHSGFTVEVGERQPGDKVFDANTGKPFLIPDPLNDLEQSQSDELEKNA